MHLLLAETSKVPFYFAGAGLAVWAVILAAIGLNRPDFPFNAAGQRAVIGFTLILMVLTLGTAIVIG